MKRFIVVLETPVTAHFYLCHDDCAVHGDCWLGRSPIVDHDACCGIYNHSYGRAVWARDFLVSAFQCAAGASQLEGRMSLVHLVPTQPPSSPHVRFPEHRGNLGHQRTARTGNLLKRPRSVVSAC